MRKELEFLGEGRLRRTYISRTGKYVLKMPRKGEPEEYGEMANANEARDYEQNRFLGKDKLARCRLLYCQGKLCLLMEKLEPVNWTQRNDSMPQWVDAIDCRQVGYDKNKKLKAYDWDDIRLPLTEKAI